MLLGRDNWLGPEEWRQLAEAMKESSELAKIEDFPWSQDILNPWSDDVLKKKDKLDSDQTINLPKNEKMDPDQQIDLQKVVNLRGQLIHNGFTGLDSPSFKVFVELLQRPSAASITELDLRLNTILDWPP